MAATPTQYRLVQAIPLIPVGIAFISSFFLSDTPRWLASKDRGDEALAALARLRNSPTADHRLSVEYEEIQGQIRTKQQNLDGVPFTTIIKEIATTSTYRKRFLLGAAMQTIAQWSGGNGITYYIPQVRLACSSYCFLSILTTYLDFRICRCGRHKHIPYHLRCIRYRQASLHTRLHLGPRRHLRPSPLYAHRSLPPMHYTHLHVNLHVRVRFL